MITRPMLAANQQWEPDEIEYPVLVTPKVDGIRCIKVNGKVLTRSFKPLPNIYTRELLSSLPDGVDGELVVPHASFNEIQSAFMTQKGEPNVKFYVFDYVTDISTPYKERVENLKNLDLPTNLCKKLIPILVDEPKQLLKLEAKALKLGYEGIMVRTPDSPYKCGRSTFKQGWLLKRKLTKDSEAVIIGFEEQMTNTNEQEENEIGLTKRSSAKAGMVPANTLGKFIVREIGDTPWKGKEFAIGTFKGLTKENRDFIWRNQEKFLGKIITYNYLAVGIKDLPRTPSGKGFRSPLDIDL